MANIYLKNKDYFMKNYNEFINESKKDKLIQKVMNTVYKDDDPKYDASNLAHLKTLSVDKLEDMISDYEHSED